MTKGIPLLLTALVFSLAALAPELASARGTTKPPRTKKATKTKARVGQRHGYKPRKAKRPDHRPLVLRTARQAKANSKSPVVRTFLVVGAMGNPLTKAESRPQYREVKGKLSRAQGFKMMYPELAKLGWTWKSARRNTYRSYHMVYLRKDGTRSDVH